MNIDISVPASLLPAIVRLNGVSQTFPSRAGAPAVHAMGPITLDLRQGEFFSIVGPSGCGKSTFLEVLAGLTTPTNGEVVMDGKQVRGSFSDGVGVVFQEDASFPWLTVWKNITFGLKRNGVDPKIATERAERALALTGLTAFRDSYPAQLSGG